MPRKLDPLKQVKRDVSLSLKLWRATVKYYIKRLESGDNLSTREAEQVNIFLRNNDISLSKFVSLNSVDQAKSLDQLSGGLDAPLALPAGGESGNTGESGGGVKGGLSDPQTLKELSALEFEDSPDPLLDGKKSTKEQDFKRSLDDLPAYGGLEP